MSYVHALTAGTRIDSYEIRDVLGAGGFGITYKAWDTDLHSDVAIKEYLPTDVAMRMDDGSTVEPKGPRDKGGFEYGLKKFLDEARTLARFKEPTIVRVTNFVEANGTAYLVMEYEKGSSLQQHLDEHPAPLTEERIKEIIVPVLNGLRTVHAHNILHRDIKPANIYLRDEGTPLLIDFGAARQALGERSRSLTTLVTGGYAPFEQYSTRGKQGPWSDIYATGATMYRCAIGEAPMEATARIADLHDQGVDPLPPAQEAGRGRYSKTFLAAIDAMLEPLGRDRPQSVGEVLSQLEHGVNGGERDAPPTIDHAVTRMSRSVPAFDPPPTSKDATAHPAASRRVPYPASWLLVSAGLGTVLVLIAAAVIIHQGSHEAATETPVAVILPEEAPIPTPSAAEEKEAAGVEVPRHEPALTETEPALTETEPAFTETEPAFTKTEPTTVGSEIDAMLATADEHLNAYQLTSPPGANALELYERILARDSGNEKAQQGLQRIADRYARLARDRMKRLDHDKARSFVVTGLGIVPDHPRLLTLAEEVATISAQSAEEQFLQGERYYQRKDPAPDYDRAFQSFLLAAKKGHAGAQRRVAGSYLYGLGVETDPAQALVWFEKAASQGEVSAQFKLAKLYLDGSVVDRDEKRAFELFLAAAKAGHVKARRRVGGMYRKGIGVKRNLVKSLRWKTMALIGSKGEAEETPE